jgi:nucleotide-binding universal stress UspA family protein
MHKTILVPLDGSSVAEAILPEATELARLQSAAVVLLQVVELPHLVDMPKGEAFDALPQLTVGDVQAHVGEARTYLAAQERALDALGVTARTRVEFGPIVATIMRVAAEEEADLIAMASHGRGGPADVYYGSVAAGILQRIDRPLLIVRGQ